MEGATARSAYALSTITSLSQSAARYHPAT